MSRPILLTLLGLLCLPAFAQNGVAPSLYDELDSARQGRYIRYGQRGVKVQALQYALTAAGFPTYPDGAFGPLTLGSVLQFQRSQSLTADGIVGPQTVSAFDRVLGLNGSNPGGGNTGGGTPGGSNTGGGTPGGNPNPAPPSTITPGASIPDRPSNALSGSQFIDLVRYHDLLQRGPEVVQQLTDGNLPDFLRTFQAIDFTANGHTARIWVTRDYLAVGSDDDYVRIGLGSQDAQTVADAFDCYLPTRKIVDGIHAVGDDVQSPQPMTPGPQMTSSTYIEQHNTMIEAKRVGRPLDELVVGHKKDVVITNRLAWNPQKVAIYGWHYTNGTPIQPLSTVHVHWYVDYSHGVRLVHRYALLDGQVMDVADILAHPLYHTTLSDEGIMPSARVP